jgi:hypothetical protein
MRIRISERGQALAEYMPLIPPALLLSILILIPLAEHTGDIFCYMVNALEPEKCQVITTEDDLEPTDEMDDCIVLNESEGAAQCDQSDDCLDLPGVNFGTFWGSEPIETFVIKSGQNYFKYYPGTTDDGCYTVNINNDDEYIVQWEKYGEGSDCQDISNTQTWKILVCK